MPTKDYFSFFFLLCPHIYAPVLCTYSSFLYVSYSYSSSRQCVTFSLNFVNPALRYQTKLGQYFRLLVSGKGTLFSNLKTKFEFSSELVLGEEEKLFLESQLLKGLHSMSGSKDLLTRNLLPFVFLLCIHRV